MDVSVQSKLVLIVAFPDLPLLEIAGPGDVFFQASRTVHEKSGVENAYKVLVVAADRSDQVITRSGITISTPFKRDDIREPVDTLIIAGYNFVNPIIEASDFYEWVSGMYPKV